MSKTPLHRLLISMGTVSMVVGLVGSFACCSGLSCNAKSEKDDIEFVIDQPLYFGTKTVSSLKQADIQGLRGLPLFSYSSFTGSKEPVVLTLTTRNGLETVIHTVDEYRVAINNGAFANTTVDRVMESYFKDADVILSLLERARLARASYISSPPVGVSNLELLPSTLLKAGITTDERFKELPVAENKSISELLKENPSMSVVEGPNVVTFQAQQGFFSIRELARSDFNGDGVEDILVSKGYKVVGGTLGYRTHFILTRKDNRSMLSIRNAE